MVIQKNMEFIVKGIRYKVLEKTNHDSAVMAENLTNKGPKYVCFRIFEIRKSIKKLNKEVK